MHDIKSLCLASMLAGIIGAIIPSGKMKGAFASFCAVVMIFYIVSPISDIKAKGLRNFSFENESRDELLLSDVRTAEVMLYEQMLEKALEEKFRESGLVLTLKINCEKLGDEIKVNCITVSGCENEGDRYTTEKILTDSFVGAKVVFEGESNG